jgi:hypothetical protein
MSNLMTNAHGVVRDTTGAMMSNRAGCELADRFKAIAPVAGNIRLNSNFPGKKG